MFICPTFRMEISYNNSRTCYVIATNWNVCIRNRKSTAYAILPHPQFSRFLESIHLAKHNVSQLDPFPENDMELLGHTEKDLMETEKYIQIHGSHWFDSYTACATVLPWMGRCLLSFLFVPPECDGIKTRLNDVNGRREFQNRFPIEWISGDQTESNSFPGT